MASMNRWDKAREADPAIAPVSLPNPNAGGMTQAQFFRPREKTEAQKLEEQRKLAEKLRGR